MKQPEITPPEEPYDLHERLLVFACEVVRAVQFLHRRNAIARELSYQILSAGTSVGANYEESDGASSLADFVAKTRIALKEAKETRSALKCAVDQACWRRSSTRSYGSQTKSCGYLAKSSTMPDVVCEC